MEKELKIIPPKGYEIDRECSTLDCIKFKPIVKRWRDNKDALFVGYFINNDCRIIQTAYCSNNDFNSNVFATIKQAKSALAMAQISQIMANDERFGGVVTDEEWNESEPRKIVIVRKRNEIYLDYSYTNYEFLAFHTLEQCELFLEEYEDLIRDYFML